MTSTLRIVGPDGLAAEVASGVPASIGRAEDCELVVADLRVSRVHLRVEWRDGEPWFVDVSSNGVFDPGGSRCGEAPVLGSQRLLLGALDGPAIDLLHGEPPGADAEPAVRSGGGAAGPAGDTAAGAAVAANNLTIKTPGGTVLINGASVDFEPGTFTAVLGPTGAGKSTLLRALGGLLVPAAGTISVSGRDLYEEYDELRPRIGYVPQDDIVHTRLTARQALTFGAELRLPDATTRAERDELVERTAADLGLTDHLDKRISNLSGGQRKRVSVALELLTRPAVLLLDEPTSGLDPGYEDAIMSLFRRLADDGCTVIVVTHSTASLDRCDQVVFLGSGGWVAYAGDPAGALAAIGASDHPSAFRLLEREAPPVRPSVGDRRTDATPAGADTAQRHPSRPTYPNSAETQFVSLIRRSAALLLTDPRALGVSLASAFIPAVLLAVLVGTSAFSLDGSSESGAARTLLTGVIISAGVIGAANGLREIVKELPIYRRERVAGLRRSTYLASKFVVLGSLTTFQALVVVAVATAAASPGAGNLLPAHIELSIAATAAALTCLVLGLFISAMVDTSEKALAMIPVVFVVLWLFSGTVSDLTEQPLMNQIAYLSPSNWGVAAAASTIDLPAIDGCTSTTDLAAGAAAASPPVCDARWGHSLVQWLANLVALAALGAAGYVATDWALARKEHLEQLRRQHLAGDLISWAGRLLGRGGSSADPGHVGR